jgi:hypothetical protein
MPVHASVTANRRAKSRSAYFGAMSDQRSQLDDHPQDNQSELQQHNGQVVLPPDALAIIQTAANLTYLGCTSC